MRRHWLILLLATDLFFTFLVWLIRGDIFAYVAVMLFLFTGLIFFTGCVMEKSIQKKQLHAWQAFFCEPDEKNKKQLFELIGTCWQKEAEAVALNRMEQAQSLNDKEMELNNYQEFIEAWTHEIKTPMSLAALVLHNHREEMSPYVYKRMEHVRHSIGNHVDRILYYARLQADHVDYRLEKLNLAECVRECLQDFYGIAEEGKIDIRLDVPSLNIVSDKKVLIFMLSQILSNAFKYTAGENGTVGIYGWAGDGEDERIHLAVRDNGRGIFKEDFPFLFDKGFTGNHPDRQNATGMGLYLVKKYAKALAVEVNIEPGSILGKGFGIQLVFPLIS